MNQVSEEAKASAIKTLAIIGFIGMIIIGVWLAVKIVSLLPSAFSSLADLVGEMQDERNDSPLAPKSDKDVVNSEESFVVSWTAIDDNARYSFSYECAEGISVTLRAGNATDENIACDEAIPLPKEVTEIEVYVTSEKSRFTDLSYTIAEFNPETDEVLGSTDLKITIVNPSIPAGGLVVTPNPEEEEEEENETPAPTTPKPTTPVKPIIVTKTVPYFPISNPNGYSDLQVSLLAVGHMNGNVFVPATTLDNDNRTAVQIAVRNIGTKTSSDWDLDIELPDGNDTDLRNEDGLRPNEISILTIEFDAGNRTGSREISADVETKNDSNRYNDSFSTKVYITN